eukprot:1627937-Lingulodinium_polyedra.AAC.1
MRWIKSGQVSFPNGDLIKKGKGTPIDRLVASDMNHRYQHHHYRMSIMILLLGAWAFGFSRLFDT